MLACLNDVFFFENEIFAICGSYHKTIKDSEHFFSILVNIRKIVARVWGEIFVLDYPNFWIIETI